MMGRHNLEILQLLLHPGLFITLWCFLCRERSKVIVCSSWPFLLSCYNVPITSTTALLGSSLSSILQYQTLKYLYSLPTVGLWWTSAYRKWFSFDLCLRLRYSGLAFVCRLWDSDENGYYWNLSRFSFGHLLGLHVYLLQLGSQMFTMYIVKASRQFHPNWGVRWFVE